ncbi:tRNA synthetases class II [Reticulomyxa filosa]|uniref:tRNA synthetases class II n=1 Tax=Reticulomyxa filosa TaxID=46433 RepID=X6LPT6_RETFI|nr:tRNA synthetases class II [Reticulomyxa filosa]|eukprot:ETO03649.1 tRNA synthetases class II [Reticulomyxa filosa]
MTEEAQTKSHSEKPKKEKLSKAQRQALRESQQKGGIVLNHPDDDGPYGDLELNKSQYKTDRQWAEIKDLSAKLEGKEFLIRGRVHASRSTGNLIFIVVRQGFSKVQVTLSKSETVTPQMIKYASKCFYLFIYLLYN